MSQFIQHMVDAISLGALYALASLSVAVIFGVARIVNFANGEMITIAGYGLIAFAGLIWPLALILTVLVVVLAAVLMDRVVFRRARETPPTTLLISSFGVSYFLQNAMQLIEGSRAKSLSFGSSLINSVSIASVRFAAIDIVSIGVTAALLIGLTIFLNRSTVGRQLRAASEDFTMTRLLGVRADRVILLAFAMSGALAAVTGILLTIQTAAVTPTFGVEPVIISFVAVVIGGIGSLKGAALGGFIFGILIIILQVVLPQNLTPYRDAFVFGLVVVMLLVRPQGLLPPVFAKERV